MPKKLCPCGNKKIYKYCCGMYLSGEKKPETAEKLMRSRYTAFCQGNIDYLIATLHRDQRSKSDYPPGTLSPPDLLRKRDRAELTKSINQTQWLGLTVINTNQKNEAIAYVEFEAIYQVNQPQQLHERSKFIKDNGNWFYVDGEILPGTIPKRHQPCWCGSGEKYKKCHGV